VVHGAVRGLFALLGILVLGLLIVLSVFAWRLSSGPISLDFLTPYIEEALSAKDGGLAVRLDTTVLTLAGDSRSVEVRALNVRAYVAEAEQPMATVPEMALTLNGRALLSGVLAPHSVRLYRPRLHLVRDENGDFQWGVGDQSQTGQSDDVVDRLVEALVGTPDPSQPGRYLQRAAVVDADLVVEDLRLGTRWHSFDTDLDLRRTPDGLTGSVQMALDLDGEQGTLRAETAYDKEDGGLAAEVWFTGLRPAAFARLGGPLTHLGALDLPLSGTIRAHGNADGSMSEVSFDLDGGAGMLNLPDPVGVLRKVDSLAVRGRAFDGLKQARLEELSIDLGGPRLTLTGEAEGLGGDTRVKLDAAVHQVPVDELATLWPAVAAANARDWVVSNLSAGMVHEAKASVLGRSPSGRFDDLVVEQVSGDLRGEGVTVDYLRPMPAVKNASAHATFDASDFRVAVGGGELYGLKLKEGAIVLSGLDQEDQFADIDLTVAGPVVDALRLIDSKPLGYAGALGIDPAAAGGQVTTRLKLKFPLLADLKLDDLEVKVHASTQGVSLPKVVMDQDLSQGDLKIDVDAKGLDASGSIVLGTIPADLKWRENFAAKGVPFRSRYQVQAARVDEDQRKALGLDGVPFVAPFISGPVGAAVVATMQGGGSGTIDAKIDLSPAHMTLPGLGWRKEERTTGGAQVQVRLDKNKLAAVPSFVVNAGDLQTAGSAAFNADGTIRRVDFSRLAYGGRTEVEGSIGFRNGALDIAMRGPSFNAEPVVSSGEETPAEADAAALRERGKKAELPPMTVNAQVQSMWLSKQGRMTDASVAMQHDGEDWRTMSVKGVVGEGKTFDMQLAPAGERKRSIRIVSNDAGAVLRAFDAYEHMVAGKLEVDAAYDDSREDQPLSGTVRITDYQIVNAPALARLLTVAALTGIVDVLKGQGISFTNLDAPFTLTDGLLQIKDTRAWGPALGITAKGQVDLDKSRMALEGTVVPAYALNSVLGKIPVLGWLVTGGEKGGGLVAFNFTMKGPAQNPDVTVNPLSALTPGFLRNLFNIFDDGTGTEARKPQPEQKPAGQ
jgi:hypothetical protein